MRNYIVASWNDADQYDYSGEQIGHRRSKSQKVHFNPDGSACVASYADPEPKSKVSIQDRILPQAKRLSVLRQQMIELETEYKTTDMSIDEYSQLRDIIVAKIQRQEILYKRAASVKPKSYEPEEEHYEQSTQESYETPTSTSHKGSDVERKNSWVKLRINVPKDLIYFVCGSMILLVAMKIIF